MELKNEEIIRKIRCIDQSDIDNIDKIRLHIDIVREVCEGYKMPKVGESICYIESGGVYFQISEDSFKNITHKIEEIRAKTKGEEILNETEYMIRMKHISKIEEGIANMNSKKRR